MRNPGDELRISPSSYKTFRDCQRKWWFEKVLKVEKEESKDSFVIGTTLHAVVESYIQDGLDVEDSLADILPNVKDVEAYSGGEEKLRKVVTNAFNKGRALVEPLREAYIAGHVRIEQQVAGMAGVLPFLGFFDVFVEAHDNVPPYIIDHKTSKQPNGIYTHQSDRDATRDPQLGFYAWCLVYAGTDYDGPCRVQHIYYPTASGEARRGPIGTHTRESAKAIFDDFVSVAGQMNNIASLYTELHQQDHVAVNAKSCSKFGGCPFATSVCKLKSLMKAGPTTRLGEKTDMSSMLDKFKKRPAANPIDKFLAAVQGAASFDEALAQAEAGIASDAAFEAPLVAALEARKDNPEIAVAEAPAVKPAELIRTAVNPPDAVPLVTREMQAIVQTRLMEIQVPAEALAKFTPEQLSVIDGLVAVHAATTPAAVQSAVATAMVPPAAISGDATVDDDGEEGDEDEDVVVAAPVIPAAPKVEPATTATVNFGTFEPSAEDLTKSPRDLHVAATLIIREHGGEAMTPTAWTTAAREALGMSRLGKVKAAEIHAYMVEHKLASFNETQVVVFDAGNQINQVAPASVAPPTVARGGGLETMPAPAPAASPSFFFVLFGAICTSGLGVPFEAWLEMSGVNSDYFKTCETQAANKVKEPLLFPYFITPYMKGDKTMIAMALEAYQDPAKRPAMLIVPREHPLGASFVAQLDGAVAGVAIIRGL